MPTQNSLETNHLNNQFKIALLNAHSIKNKMVNICDSLQSKGISFCGITETWLHPEDGAEVKELHDIGFNVFHTPRQHKQGGGVGILAKSGIEVEKLNTPKFKQFELIEVILKGYKKKFLFSTFYRTGALDTRNKEEFLSEIEEYTTSLTVKKEDIILWGDFNIHVEDSNDTFAEDFIDLMKSMGFEQLIDFPTHIRGGTLDLVFTRDTTTINNICVYNNDNDILLSDHFMIEMCIDCQSIRKPQRSEYLFRPISSINVTEFSEELYKLLSNVDMHILPLDDRVNYFFRSTQNILNTHAPLQTRFSSISSKPFNHFDIDEAKRSKRRAERRFRKTGLDCDKQTLNVASRNLARVVKNKTSEYYSDRLNRVTGDPKATYDIINSLLNRNKVRSLPEHDEVQELVEVFEDFFCKKIERLRSSMKSIPATNTTTENYQNIETLDKFDLVSEADLKSVVDSIKTKYSTIDDIPAKILKSVMNTASEFILEIVNESLQSGYFPKVLKNAHVIPIPKSKKQEDVNNLEKWRPICHISIVSKALEKCALLQLDQHLKRNNLLLSLQSAYKIYHSCETALLKVHNDILSIIDSKTNVLVVLLDFSAAFDTISHENLFQKLHNEYGITGTALQWFKSYVTDRTFQVKIDQHYSNGNSTECGVQQGSVMGPKIFCLYTQEISSIITKHGLKFHIFADDITIYSPVTANYCELNSINNCLEEITVWAQHNSLKLNDSKTKFIEVKTRQSNLSIKELVMLDNNFKCDPHVKSLGVIIDENFTFKNQITDVCKKGFGMLRQLWRISSKLSSVSLKIQMIHGCILSRMDYCNALYLDLPQKQIQKLQRLLNAAIRFVFGLKSRKISITPYLKKAHILPVHLRLRFKTCVMVYKCIHGIAPTYLCELIQKKDSLQSLRVYQDTTLLFTPKLEIQNYRNRKFQIAAPRQWNILPQTIRESTTLESFKTKLKTFLFNQF